VGLGWVVYQREAWRAPALLQALLAIAAAQAALHVLLPRFVTPWARAAYAIVQCALSIAFGAVSGSVAWTVQLLLLVLAEAIAVLPSLRAQTAAALTAVGLGAGAATVLFGVGALARAMMHGAPVAASIVVFGRLYHRQARSREESQAALVALDAANRRLVEYAAEVERLTVASERQRFARELHDTLAQGLVGLVLQLEALEAHLARGDVAKAVQILRHARERARSALADARTAISDLRTGSPSLQDAIRDESTRFSAATGIPCTLSIPSTLSLPEETTGHAIRCVAEGLTNVARHARASRASVSVAESDDAVTVELCDDGVGFDVASAEGREGHYGLLGLRERARLAGGSLEIASDVGRGTVLRFHLPRRLGEAPP
jgi:NarL family two-component system sensor histidine kinase YdfH